MYIAYVVMETNVILLRSSCAIRKHGCKVGVNQRLLFTYMAIKAAAAVLRMSTHMRIDAEEREHSV